MSTIFKNIKKILLPVIICAVIGQGLFGFVLSAKAASTNDNLPPSDLDPSQTGSRDTGTDNLPPSDLDPSQTGPRDTGTTNLPPNDLDPAQTGPRDTGTTNLPPNDLDPSQTGSNNTGTGATTSSGTPSAAASGSTVVRSPQGVAAGASVVGSIQGDSTCIRFQSTTIGASIVTSGTQISYPAGLNMPACAADLSQVILYVTSWILWVAGQLFDYALDWSLRISDLVKTFPIVVLGWQIFRDLANLCFMFILLYIAVMTILRATGFETKRVLITVMITAVLLNFSFLFAAFIIDTSNTVAATIFNDINPQSSGTTSQAHGISGIFLQGLGLTTIYNTVGTSGAGSVSAAAVTGQPPGTWNIVIIGLGGSLLMLVTSFVLLAASVLFLVRLIVLVLLLMSSSIAVAAYALPQTKSYFDKWLKLLINQSLFAPAYLLMVYIVTKIISATAPAQQGVVNGTASLGSTNLGQINFAGLLATGNGGAINSLFIFGLLIGLMISSLIIASKFGAHGASRAISIGKSAARSAGGYVSGTVGRNTIGRLAYYSAKDGAEREKRWEEEGFKGKVKSFAYRATGTKSVNNYLATTKFGSAQSRTDVIEAQRKAALEGVNDPRRKGNAARTAAFLDSTRDFTDVLRKKDSQEARHAVSKMSATELTNLHALNPDGKRLVENYLANVDNISNENRDPYDAVKRMSAEDRAKLSANIPAYKTLTNKFLADANTDSEEKKKTEKAITDKEVKEINKKVSERNRTYIEGRIVDPSTRAIKVDAPHDDISDYIIGRATFEEQRKAYSHLSEDDRAGVDEVLSRRATTTPSGRPLSQELFNSLDSAEKTKTEKTIIDRTVKAKRKVGTAEIVNYLRTETDSIKRAGFYQQLTNPEKAIVDLDLGDSTLLGILKTGLSQEDVNKLNDEVRKVKGGRDIDAKKAILKDSTRVADYEATLRDLPTKTVADLGPDILTNPAVAKHFTYENLQTLQKSGDKLNDVQKKAIFDVFNTDPTANANGKKFFAPGSVGVNWGYIINRIMNDYPKNLIDNAFKALSESQQDAVLSLEVTESIQNISKKHKLMIDKMSALGNEIRYCLMGLTPSNLFTARIKSRLGINQENAEEITKDVNDQIFIPIRKSLVEKTIKKNPDSLSKEDILSEIESPQDYAVSMESEDLDPGTPPFEVQFETENSSDLSWDHKPITISSKLLEDKLSEVVKLPKEHIDIKIDVAAMEQAEEEHKREEEENKAKRNSYIEWQENQKKIAKQNKVAASPTASTTTPGKMVDSISTKNIPPLRVRKAYEADPYREPIE